MEVYKLNLCIISRYINHIYISAHYDIFKILLKEL